VEWTLDPDRRAVAPKHEQRTAAGDSSRLHECTNCGVVGVAGEPCWRCGYLPQRAPRAVEVGEGELGLVDRSRRAKPNAYDPADRERWYGMLISVANERGYKPGWAKHKYREKFGTWPPWGSVPTPLPPTPEVRSWVRSRQIAYAKRRSA
jgi:hypothetical protein